MLGWGSAAFNVMGPMNGRTIENFPIAGELTVWLSQLEAAELAEGSIGRAILDAGNRGEIPPETGHVVIQQYVAAGLDFTIAAIGNVIALLAANPDQFALVRADPDLIPSAFNESVRYEAPAPLTGRLVTEDTEIDGTVIPAGAQAAILSRPATPPGALPGPERFDLTRKSLDNLGLWLRHSHLRGAGPGQARGPRGYRRAGQAGPPVHHRRGDPADLNNSIRSLATLPVTSVEAA